MNSQFSYPVQLRKQKEGGYLIRFPDFPEAITQGDTREEALSEAQDCLEEAIANRVEMKLAIPAPSRIKRCHYISLSTTFAAKIALYMTMKEKQMTNTALAAQLKCDEKEIRRLLDPHYQSKLPRIEQALHQLGKRLNVHVVSI